MMDAAMDTTNYVGVSTCSYPIPELIFANDRFAKTAELCISIRDKERGILVYTVPYQKAIRTLGRDIFLRLLNDLLDEDIIFDGFDIGDFYKGEEKHVDGILYVLKNKYESL